MEQTICGTIQKYKLFDCNLYFDPKYGLSTNGVETLIKEIKFIFDEKGETLILNGSYGNVEHVALLKCQCSQL